MYLFQVKLHRLNRLQEVAMLATVPQAASLHPRRRRPGSIRSSSLDGYDQTPAARPNGPVAAHSRTHRQHHQAHSRRRDDPRVATLPFFRVQPGAGDPAAAAPAKTYDILQSGTTGGAGRRSTRTCCRRRSRRSAARWERSAFSASGGTQFGWAQKEQAWSRRFGSSQKPSAGCGSALRLPCPTRT